MRDLIFGSRTCDQFKPGGIRLFCETSHSGCDDLERFWRMKCSTCCENSRKLAWFLGAGTFICVFGGVLAFVWPPVFKTILRSQLKLENGTRLFSLWSEAPIPIYLEMHFFNLTNPEPVKAGLEKPKFVEMGPYVYEEKRKKVDVSFNNDDTVDFEMQRFWYFRRDLSKGSEKDEVMSLNALAATAASLATEKGTFFEWAINGFFILKRIPLFHKKTVKELMFEGYEDPIIDFAEELPFQIFDVPFDKFGWFYPRNGSQSYDGLFTMGLGQKDLSTFGQMVRWNGTDKTPYYASYCGRVNGSAGEFFPPFLEPYELSLFITDICRTIKLSFSEVTWMHGLKSYRFVADRKMLASPAENPDNWCFCKNGNQTLCSPSGTCDISRCRYGAPAFVSFPHFYLGDESLLEAVQGLSPDPEKHKTTLTVEPTTGLPMQVRAALQINMKMIRSEGAVVIEMLKHVNTTYMPIMWFRQIADITDDLASAVSFPVMANMLMPPAGYAMIGLGIVVIFAGAAIYVASSRREDQALPGLVGRTESRRFLLDDQNVTDPRGGTSNGAA